jgi:hypothetical protein
MQYLDCSVLHKRLAPPGVTPPRCGRAGRVERAPHTESLRLRCCANERIEGGWGENRPSCWRCYNAHTPWPQKNWKTGSSRHQIPLPLYCLLPQRRIGNE